MSITSCDILGGLTRRAFAKSTQSFSLPSKKSGRPALLRFPHSLPAILLQTILRYRTKASYATGRVVCAATVPTYLTSWSQYVQELSHKALFDDLFQLGGDGTVLFTSWLFQRIVPPVLSFALGSLGFLTNFDFANHRAVMDAALDAGIRVNLRMRFTCTVYRAVDNTECRRTQAVKKGATGEIMMRNVEEGGWEALESGLAGIPSIVDGSGKPVKDREIKCFTTRPVETFEVLNDLVVDRGPSPYVSLLELFGEWTSCISFQNNQ
jgi:NAD kinase